MVYNLPMETTLLPIYSKNTIIFLCIRYSVSLFQNSNRSVIIIFFFPKSFDDLVLLAKKLQSISQPHSARQFKGTGTLLVGSTIGNKMWYNTDGKKKKNKLAPNSVETEARSCHPYSSKFCCTTNSCMSLPAIVLTDRTKHKILPIPLLYFLAK